MSLIDRKKMYQRISEDIKQEHFSKAYREMDYYLSPQDQKDLWKMLKPTLQGEQLYKNDNESLGSAYRFMADVFHDVPELRQDVLKVMKGTLPAAINSKERLSALWYYTASMSKVAPELEKEIWDMRKNAVNETLVEWFEKYPQSFQDSSLSPYNDVRLTPEAKEDHELKKDIYKFLDEQDMEKIQNMRKYTKRIRELTDFLDDYMLDSGRGDLDLINRKIPFNAQEKYVTKLFENQYESKGKEKEFFAEVANLGWDNNDVDMLNRIATQFMEEKPQYLGELLKAVKEEEKTPQTNDPDNPYDGVYYDLYNISFALAEIAYKKPEYQKDIVDIVEAYGTNESKIAKPFFVDRHNRWLLEGIAINNREEAPRIVGLLARNDEHDDNEHRAAMGLEPITSTVDKIFEAYKNDKAFQKELQDIYAQARKEYTISMEQDAKRERELKSLEKYGDLDYMNEDMALEKSLIKKRIAKIKEKKHRGANVQKEQRNAEIKEPVTPEKGNKLSAEIQAKIKEIKVNTKD